MAIFVADSNESPPAIGQPWRGGVYVGMINGYYLIANLTYENSNTTFVWGVVGSDLQATMVSANPSWTAQNMREDGLTITTFVRNYYQNAQPDFAAFFAAANISGSPYSDWYLPARNELLLVMESIGSTLANQTDTRFSATQRDVTLAETVYPNQPTVSYGTAKNASRRIIPVRREYPTVYKGVGSVYVGDSSVWKPAQRIWVADNSSWKLAFESLPETIGQSWGGGYYGGTFLDRSGPYAMVISPKSAEATFSTRSESLSYCTSYRGGGYSDWVLPSEMALFAAIWNLRPSGNTSILWNFDYVKPYAERGSGLVSVSQTTLPDWQSGGVQCFESQWYWADPNGSSIRVHMGSGSTSSSSSGTNYARPMRLIKLPFQQQDDMQWIESYYRTFAIATMGGGNTYETRSYSGTLNTAFNTVMFGGGSTAISTGRAAIFTPTSPSLPTSDMRGSPVKVTAGGSSNVFLISTAPIGRVLQHHMDSEAQFNAYVESQGKIGLLCGGRNLSGGNRSAVTRNGYTSLDGNSTSGYTSRQRHVVWRDPLTQMLRYKDTNEPEENSVPLITML